MCPPPGDLPTPGMEHASLVSFALTGGFFTTSATWEALPQVSRVPTRREANAISILELQPALPELALALLDPGLLLA